MKKGLYIGIIAALSAAIIVSAAYLGNYFMQGKKEADRFEELSQLTQVTEEPSQPTQPTPPSVPDDEPLPTDPEVTTTPTTASTPEAAPGEVLAPYKELHEMNPDMIGWIRIDGTKVNYPVMYTPPEKGGYYLYRNFDKADSVRGSIFADEKSDPFKPSDNITLYGHNMKDGSMFAALGEYYEKSAWENNSLITFDTLYEYHTYKIFAVFKTSAVLNEGFPYHKFVDANTELEFNDFVATCKRLAFYDTGITPAWGDKLILLSTCEYTLEDGRFVVAAVRIT